MKIGKMNVNDLASLSKVLGVDTKVLVYSANNLSKLVRDFEIPKKSGGKRGITEPNSALKALQRNIKTILLDDYKYPGYVFGLGGNTLKDNAKPHTGKLNTIKIDLKDFYPSIGYAPVYKMWRGKFGFDHDSARILSKLTTLNNQLKQGFPTSSHIATIVAEEFTQAINAYSKTKGYHFGQYIDDLNISGKKIDYREFFKMIIPLSRKYGFHIKLQKTKVTSPLNGKVITGVSIYNQRLRASRDIRHRAIRALKDFSQNNQDESAFRSVQGYMGFLRHINKKDGNKYKELINKAKAKPDK